MSEKPKPFDAVSEAEDIVFKARDKNEEGLGKKATDIVKEKESNEKFNEFMDIQREKRKNKQVDGIKKYEAEKDLINRN